MARVFIEVMAVLMGPGIRRWTARATSSLHADVGERPIAAGAELGGVVLEALRDPPVADLHARAVRLEFRAAFVGDIGDRPDRALEPRRGVIERQLALSRQPVAVRIEARQQPGFARRHLRAVPGQLAVAALEHLRGELALHRRGHVLGRRLARSRRDQTDDAEAQKSLDDSALHCWFLPPIATTRPSPAQIWFRRSDPIAPAVMSCPASRPQLDLGPISAGADDLDLTDRK